MRRKSQFAAANRWHSRMPLTGRNGYNSAS